MTPESKVKKLVRLLLYEFSIQEAKDAGVRPDSWDGWYFMPGQNGYGVKGIPDFIGHYKGFFFSIETKAPGKEPQGFQELQMKAIRESGGAVFMVDGEHSLLHVRLWLDKIRRTVR